jgi:uncharacterized protein
VAQNDTDQENLARLRGHLEELGSVLVAFSGGTDSALLVRVAGDVLGSRAAALTALSPTLPQEELAEARAFAEKVGIRHLLVPSREMENPDFVRNPEDRCYFCKSELFRLCRREADRLGLRWVLDGTQKDDLGDHRPGLRAAEEEGVRSPFLELGLGKREVRVLSRMLGLPTWDKPSMACLSSRFPTGMKITLERLRRVEECESFLRRHGFRQLRVRLQNGDARVELAPEEMERLFQSDVRHRFVAHCKEMGFERVTLDLEGYLEREGG